MIGGEVGLKAVVGAVAGALLGVISVLFGPPTETLSYSLIGLYLAAYPVSVVTLRAFGRGAGFKKGVSVFYSIEFLFWAGVYEALSYASIMR